MADGSKPFSREEVLARVPQQDPFRFIDGIDALDEDHIVGNYRFPEDADFYGGQFPGNRITPGVLLIETMAQTGVVAFGLYLLSLQEGGRDEVEKLLTIFTEANVEFSGMVRPGQRVVTTAHKDMFRRRKLRARVEMRLDDGALVASGTVAGMGVPR